MRSFNLNSTVNVLVSLGNDRLNSVLDTNRMRDLMRSCFTPLLRSIARVHVQLWQPKRQRWIAQPVFVGIGNEAGTPATASFVAAYAGPVTG